MKNQTQQISATAVLNLTKFNLLKNFEKGWRLTHQSKALIKARKIQLYVPIRKMTLSRDIDGSIWKSSFLNRRYLRPRTKSKIFKVIFFLCDPKSTKNSWNLNGKAKFCIKSFVWIRLDIGYIYCDGTFRLQIKQKLGVPAGWRKRSYLSLRNKTLPHYTYFLCTFIAQTIEVLF